MILAADLPSLRPGSHVAELRSGGIWVYGVVTRTRKLNNYQHEIELWVDFPLAKGCERNTLFSSLYMCCGHCHRVRSEHGPNGKCLFGSTRYTGGSE